MHDSTDGRVWNDYLEISERNREAAASIGIVRSAAQNKGQTIRVLGPRRVIIAFDPTCDDTDLLRTVVQLVRTAAIAASSRRDIEGLETAEESIQAAIDLLDGINKIRKASGSVRKSADAIDKECNTVQTGIARHLGVALDALTGVVLEAVEDDTDRAGRCGVRRRLTSLGRPLQQEGSGRPTPLITGLGHHDRTPGLPRNGPPGSPTEPRRGEAGHG